MRAYCLLTSGKVQDGGAAENAFELLESFCGIVRHVASAVLGPFTKKPIKGSCDVHVVPNMPLKEVSQAKE